MCTKSETTEEKKKHEGPPDCNPLYKFSNFAIGEENCYACETIRAALANPGSHNPLFIYGEHGTGKSHLLQAIAHERFISNPETVIKYLSCEEFSNLFLESIRSKSLSEFRDSFSSVDLLLLDDVSFLSGKQQLQQEVSDVFGIMRKHGRLVIVASSKPLMEFDNLNIPFVCHLVKEQTIELCLPGLETRFAILKLALPRYPSLEITDDMLRLIATRMSCNGRCLVNSLVRLAAYASMGEKITEAAIENLLRHLFDKDI